MKRLSGRGLEKTEIRDAESYRSTGEQGKVTVEVLDRTLILCVLFPSLLRNVPNCLLSVFDALLRNEWVYQRQRKTPGGTFLMLAFYHAH